LALEQYLAELADGKKGIGVSKLVNLSDLTDEEAALFASGWSRIAVDRRRHITHDLVDMAEDNMELNFDRVFLVCLKDPDELVRMAAIEGLADCEDPSVIDDLVDRLHHDKVEGVRAAAAISLGGFALQAELGKLRPRYSDRVKEALLAVIQGPQESVVVRRRAVEAISPLSLPEIREVIERAYQSPVPELQVSAIYAMGRNCDARWLPTLIRELSSPDAERRFEAAGACGELGEEKAVPHLIPLLQDRDEEVQLAAIGALGHIGGGEARESLNRCLSHPSPQVQQASEMALAEMEFADDPLSFNPELGH
jgi:HEAT repeat protein